MEVPKKLSLYIFTQLRLIPDRPRSKSAMRILIVLCSLIVPIYIIAQEAKHLVFIGIDGFSSTALEKTELPTIRRLMDNGSYSLKKRSVLPSSSAPNWASIFMGVPTEIHGYTQWGSKEPEITSPIELKNNILPTIFQVVKECKKPDKVACIYEWAGMKYLIDTLSLDYYQEAFDYLQHKTLLTDIACKYLQDEKPTLFGVIYASPDDMGHKYGFESEAYYAELKLIDNGINSIINAVDKAGFLNETVFIVTSDHGGFVKSHGGITLAEMETPFIIAGSQIRMGYEIEELMMQYDIASIVLNILNIEQPSFWRGHSFENIWGESSGLENNNFEEIDKDKQLIKTDYFDLNGTNYNIEPKTGIVIKRDILSDGSTQFLKYIKYD